MTEKKAEKPNLMTLLNDANISDANANAIKDILMKTDFVSVVKSIEERQKEKAFYQKTWFKITAGVIAALAIGGVFYMLNKRQTNRLLEVLQGVHETQAYLIEAHSDMGMVKEALEIAPQLQAVG